VTGKWDCLRRQVYISQNSSLPRNASATGRGEPIPADQRTGPIVAISAQGYAMAGAVFRCAPGVATDRPALRQYGYEHDYSVGTDNGATAQFKSNGLYYPSPRSVVG
jgi:hypothetical protein